MGSQNIDTNKADCGNDHINISLLLDIEGNMQKDLRTANEKQDKEKMQEIVNDAQIRIHDYFVNDCGFDSPRALSFLVDYFGTEPDNSDSAFPELKLTRIVISKMAQPEIQKQLAIHRKNGTDK